MLTIIDTDIGVLRALVDIRIIGLTAAQQPDGITVQQRQDGLKAALQDRLIDIQVSAFGVDIEGLDGPQVGSSGVKGAVLELELNIEERDEHG
ncbi:hypothetical protein I5I49_29605 [Pseudomonas aeruginosa]|uniref:hypothetical protein n=1 Tax=Pseudomonas aeruginosa TaxID=287 RepID=UPI00080316EA|nr:hypothetical protein [Pseudomonas aeruginosa]MBG4227875.1 hypothetical protein [Pseudomonas aeruginosa]MBG4239644.1 hypothetical protein [Pseudomonas aeruginosa]MBG5868243.1 hypothetical protein [Pseudomonas aeruginosa]MBG6564919.1 hypothetical protein [Pseudomonas aeruginosa]MBH3602473.1 hypothetical protein [Pseudomonas aeruginosa]